MNALEPFLNYNHEELLARLGAESFDTLKESAAREYASLKPQAPLFRQAVNRQNFSFGVPCLSIYRAALGDLDLPQEEAIDLVKEIVTIAARRKIEGSRSTRFMLRRMGRSRLLARLTERAMTTLNEPQGWLAERVHDDGHISYDVRQCGLVLYLADQAAPELCEVFCHADHVGAEYMDGLSLERTTTLANGGSVCDFRYRQTAI